MPLKPSASCVGAAQAGDPKVSAPQAAPTDFLHVHMVAAAGAQNGFEILQRRSWVVSDWGRQQHVTMLTHSFDNAMARCS
jgi:hypothetical protein